MTEKNFRRLRFAVIILIVLWCGLNAAQAAPQKAPRHVVKPLSSITVKVVPHPDFQRKIASRPEAEAPGTPWIITSNDLNSCTAWVTERASNTAELAAFRACRKAIDTAVDAAHAAAEKKTQ